jgi:hypothetical protein
MYQAEGGNRKSKDDVPPRSPSFVHHLNPGWFVLRLGRHGNKKSKLAVSITTRVKDMRRTWRMCFG